MIILIYKRSWGRRPKQPILRIINPLPFYEFHIQNQTNSASTSFQPNLFHNETYEIKRNQSQSYLRHLGKRGALLNPRFKVHIESGDPSRSFDGLLTAGSRNRLPLDLPRLGEFSKGSDVEGRARQPHDWPELPYHHSGPNSYFSNIFEVITRESKHTHSQVSYIPFIHIY